MQFNKIFKTIFEYIRKKFGFVHTNTFCEYRKKLRASPRVHLVISLDKVKCIIESANTPYIFVMGDFIADIKSSSIFVSELMEFCNMNDLCFIDKSILLFDTFTYVIHPI